jgi:predicted permease
MTALALSSIAELFGLFGLGYLANRLRLLGPGDVSRIARFAFDLLFPCLILHTVIGRLETPRLIELWPLPLIGFGFMLVGFALGFVLRRGLRSADAGVHRVFHHMCAVNNFGFLPIFIIQNSLPAEALALFFVFNLGSTAGYWTLGVMTLGGGDVRAALRKLISPPLLAMAVALAVVAAGAQPLVPGFLDRTLEKAGGIAVPLSLLVIGASFPGSFRREFARDVAYLTVLRLIVLPALKIALVWWLPVGPDVRQVCVIVALMPATATAVILTRVYGGSSEFAATATLVTTLASALTIPLGLWFLFAHG